MKKLFRYLTVIGLFLTCSWASATTFHAIVAGDTNDSRMGNGIRASFNDVVMFVKNMPGHSAFKLEEHFIEGRDLSLSSLKSKLRNLAVSRQDIVLFYYVGKGFNSRKGGKLPALFSKGETLEFKEVLSALKANNPRLLIAVADVGNQFAKPSVEKRRGRSKSLGVIVHDGYNKLFSDFEGSLIVASAYPQQDAKLDMQGGYFTTAFLGIMKEQLAADNPDWQSIIRQIKALRFDMTTSSGRAYQQEPMVDSASFIRVSSNAVTEEKLFKVEYLSGGRPLRNGDTLRVGDKVKIRLIPNKRCQRSGCNVNILHTDSTGVLISLFPHRGISVRNPIRETITFPSDYESYQVDDQPGEEVVRVFASLSGSKSMGDIVPDSLPECRSETDCVSSVSFMKP